MQPIIRPGAVLEYDLATPDVQDRYRFRILEASDEHLSFRYELDDGGGGALESGELTIRASALDAAPQMFFFSQGNVEGASELPNSGVITDHVPPFLVPRSAVRGGAESPLRLGFGAAGVVSLKAAFRDSAVDESIRERLELPLKHRKWTAPQFEVIAVDDPSWPLVTDAFVADGDWEIHLVGVQYG